MYYVILALVLILLLFSYAIFKKPMNITVVFDTDALDLHLNARWLFPFWEMKVVMDNYMPLMSIYIFKKEITRKHLKNTKQSKITSYYHYCKFQNSYVNTFYSLNDPFATSIVHIVTSYLGLFVDEESLHDTPDFLADHSYVAIKAGSDLNLGKSAWQFVKNKSKIS